jgi:DnaK suppressor protein
MSGQKTSLDQAFVEQQRVRLDALRQHLLGEARRDDVNERTFQQTHGQEAKELEDEAQRSTQIDIDQARQNVDERRLRAVDRALQKISEGTYGFSDVSGDPIPKARLDATPEAVLTVEEQAQHETRARQ